MDWGKDLDEIGEDPDEIMRRKGDMSEIKRWDWGKRMGNWVINEAMVRYFFEGEEREMGNWNLKLSTDREEREQSRGSVCRLC